ncbi:exodeoxyribonuclease VII large subunit [Microlunatus panaciterrae]|uniref:Exodeoxyribonuclease 7 large subunit n=1 Tax=Microlunatus panaciterrae TaxID=400768 RepID=A0ABS2RHF3_9ACTN|nr:exodeoxyribonuclease VII large subunit [Microlunatus panaciterrae]MBM7797982.1 exodeoxyribonuclease VII large subunit [Microlunatus panaciterrae]
MALESSPEHPQPLRAVTHAVKGWIDRLNAIWVEGQLIEINRRSASKTIFLTMRDKIANVSVSVTVSPTTLDSAGPLTEGATVVARLKPSYYETSGRLSFYCDAIKPVGEGQLLARLEQTKRMLQAEGLFNPALKKRLPFLPRAVGLITGANSAAERDVLENARRRWPAVRIETRHTLVQGPQACEQVIAALRQLDADPAIEVIVIARGGGSLEDLLPFSDEGLIRAVHSCRTPVVSAIGHETDNPILDLVADFRASTPTDAAKHVVPDVAEEADRVRQSVARVRQAMINIVRTQQDRLDAIRSRPVLLEPTASFGLRYEQLEGLRHRADRALDARIRHEQSTVEHTLARVRAMSPKATLERGYSILVDGEGHAVASVDDVDEDDDLLAHLADGQLVLAVRERRPGQ